jgi:hypothetical protein
MTGNSPMAAISQSESDEAGAPSGCNHVRHYVNRIDLDASLSEILIDLGQLFPGEPAASAQCRLVTSPSHLKMFENAIARCIRSYEERFGALLNAADNGEHPQHG